MKPLSTVPGGIAGCETVTQGRVRFDQTFESGSEAS